MRESVLDKTSKNTYATLTIQFGIWQSPKKVGNDLVQNGLLFWQMFAENVLLRNVTISKKIHYVLDRLSLQYFPSMDSKQFHLHEIQFHLSSNFKQSNVIRYSITVQTMSDRFLHRFES